MSVHIQMVIRISGQNKISTDVTYLGKGLLYVMKEGNKKKGEW